MKHIILILVGAAVLFVLVFVGFGQKASVETPEIKKTGNYNRPVKEGNCYRHTTPTGSVLACG